MSSRIYFDVTQLVHWPGKLTGIPRVTHELAIRYANDENVDVDFITWVKELGEFCVIDFLSTLKNRGQGIVYVSQAGPSVVQINSNKLVRRVAKKTLRVADRVRPGVYDKMVHNSASVRLQGSKIAKPEPGDKLFIPWGEWWDSAFTDKVVSFENQQVKVVQVIHDMATTLQPQFFEQVKVSPVVYNKEVLPKAALVLAVSQNTKRELTEWMETEKLPIPLINVFREGDDFEVSKTIRPLDSKFTDSGLKGKDFILAVGTIEAKKNHMLLYYVYKLAAKNKIDLPKMVIVGRKGWGTETTIDLLTRDPEVKDKFVLLHDTGDEELSWLYDNCLFTILASFHEGWGIPIAESVSRGVPCLCSGTSSMVEVAEGHVDHFNPASTDECLAAIQRLMDPKYYQEAQKRAKQYRQFSWGKSYSQVAKFVEEI